LQNTCKGITRKLRALVTFEDLLSTMGSNSLLKAVNAKYRIHTIADPPAQYTTRVPVDDRNQVHKTTREPYIRDIRTPDLIGPNNSNATQQIGIDLMLRVRAASI
jgi:hypothetical protein